MYWKNTSVFFFVHLFVFTLYFTSIYKSLTYRTLWFLFLFCVARLGEEMCHIDLSVKGPSPQHLGVYTKVLFSQR